MLKIELTRVEAELLHKILDQHLSELAVEIAGSELDDLAQMLEEEERSVERILQNLREQGIGMLSEESSGEYA